MELLLAKSIAGHDKGRVYVVLTSEGRNLVLVNGKNRSLEKPKIKREGHVQLIKHFPRSLREEIRKIDRWTDESVRNILKQYLKEENKIV